MARNIWISNEMDEHEHRQLFELDSPNYELHRPRELRMAMRCALRQWHGDEGFDVPSSNWPLVFRAYESDDGEMLAEFDVYLDWEPVFQPVERQVAND